MIGVKLHGYRIWYLLEVMLGQRASRSFNSVSGKTLQIIPRPLSLMLDLWWSIYCENFAPCRYHHLHIFCHYWIEWNIPTKIKQFQLWETRSNSCHWCISYSWSKNKRKHSQFPEMKVDIRLQESLKIRFDALRTSNWQQQIEPEQHHVKAKQKQCGCSEA